MTRTPQRLARELRSLFRPLVLAVVLGLLGALGLGLVGAAPAAAHSETGAIELVTAEPSGSGGLVRYVVRLTYENDGDPVADATVTAVAGATPIALAPGVERGLYTADVEASGGATQIRFTSVTPAATLEVAAPVPTTTTEPESTSSTLQATTTTAGGGEQETADEGLGNSVRSEGSGAGTAVFVGLLVALAVVAFLAVRDVRRRRARQAGANTG